jgi:DNA-binding HxlR family transcriptional regulator
MPTSKRRTVRTPLDIPIEVLGGKWKLLLLYYLASAPRRNGELLRLMPGISQKMLTQQLRELEHDEIVVRTVHEQIPPKVVYSVAPAERKRLMPLVKALCEWGYYWSSKIGAVIELPRTGPNRT